jgi:hypothetical protein
VQRAVSFGHQMQAHARDNAPHCSVPILPSLYNWEGIHIFT